MKIRVVFTQVLFILLLCINTCIDNVSDVNEIVTTTIPSNER